MPDSLKFKENTLYEKLYNASIDCILAFDRELKVIAWNKSCEAITSLSKQDVIGKNFYDVFPKAVDCNKVKNAIKQAFDGNKFFISNNETSYFHDYTEHHFVPVKEESYVNAVLIIVHDVAHRVKAENELKKLNKILDQKNRELDKKNMELMTFTQVTGHDLKEPIRKIQVFADLISSRGMVNFTDEGINYFKRIQVSIRRMINLTDDLITYAEVTADEKNSDVDLNDILKFAKHTIQHKIDGSKAIFIVKNQLPKIIGYRSMLTLLFKNLLSNAIKFQGETSTPTITISSSVLNGSEIKHTTVNPNIDYACVAIQDNGIGITSEHHPKLFDMFYKVSKKSYSGNGIGLAICEKVAKMHKGFLTVESTLDKGSTFNVFLPLS